MAETRKIFKAKSFKNLNTPVQKIHDNTVRSKASSPVNQIISLQRSIGNQAVQRMIKSGVLQIGYDFNAVRLHTGSASSKSANAINASASTYGNDIVFNHKGYNPNSWSDRKLLPHELTRVLEQTRSGGNSDVRVDISRTKKLTIQRSPGFDYSLFFVLMGSLDTAIDKSLGGKLKRLERNPPPPPGGSQPVEAMSAYRNARAAAKAAIPAGTEFVWGGKTLKIKSLNISSFTKIRSVKNMVNYYFGSNGGYILGYLFDYIKKNYRPDCTDEEKKKKPVVFENAGAVEKFFKVRATGRWRGSKYGSGGAAAFPGLSRHAGKGAFDLRFKIKYENPEGAIKTKSYWGGSGSNSKVRATSWWKKVNTVFEARNFKNLSSEYWHFNYKGAMSRPAKVLNVTPLISALYDIASYANALEYEMVDLARKCLRGGLKGNKDKLKLIEKLKAKIRSAASITLSEK